MYIYMPGIMSVAPPRLVHNIKHTCLFAFPLQGEVPPTPFICVAMVMTLVFLGSWRALYVALTGSEVEVQGAQVRSFARPCRRRRCRRRRHWHWRAWGRGGVPSFSVKSFPIGDRHAYTFVRTQHTHNPQGKRSGVLDIFRMVTTLIGRW